MKFVILLFALLMLLGLFGGLSQGNLPFQNGNGWQGNPGTCAGCP